MVGGVNGTVGGPKMWERWERDEVVLPQLTFWCATAITTANDEGQFDRILDDEIG
jgi:hypothetical protein